jgi:anthranilate 1,2-dioxygenase small subunit/terephthalate 1,2-dioxygenase oxygenase component beta subunit
LSNSSIDQQLTVQNLNARYVEAIDDGKLEAWPDFFTEQGRYRITTAENFARGLPLAMIHATSRAMLRDRVRSLRDANVYEAQRYRHVLGAPLVEADAHDPSKTGVNALSHMSKTGVNALSGALTARTSFIVARIMHTGETTLFATGSYHDRIVIEDGAARFAEKLVILDSRVIDTLLAIPL